MSDVKIVQALRELEYEPFKDDAQPDEIKGYNKYCVYYDHSLRKGDQKQFSKIIEFVFVNESDGLFDEETIIPTLEKTGLLFEDGDFGRLKKSVGGDIVNSLTLRFARPRKRKCIY